MWAKLKNSLTVAVMAIGGMIGTLFATLMSFAEALNVPEIKAQIQSVLAAYPETLGGVLLALSLAGIAARMRTLGKS